MALAHHQTLTTTLANRGHVPRVTTRTVVVLPICFKAVLLVGKLKHRVGRNLPTSHSESDSWAGDSHPLWAHGALAGWPEEGLLQAHLGVRTPGLGN